MNTETNSGPPVPAPAFGFRTPLVLEDLGDGCHWLVAYPLVYDDKVKDGGSRWTVPAGFVTDLASIPQFMQNVIPKTGKYNSAAVLHDYLYTFQPDKPVPMTRDLADNVLRRAMESCKVNIITRRLIYWGVRAGGCMIWNRHTTDLKLGLPNLRPFNPPSSPAA